MKLLEIMAKLFGRNAAFTPEQNDEKPWKRGDKISKALQKKTIGINNKGGTISLHYRTRQKDMRGKLAI
jgi:hypothetical protein